jgi:hypothetical protein
LFPPEPTMTSSPAPVKAFSMPISTSTPWDPEVVPAPRSTVTARVAKL